LQRIEDIFLGHVRRKVRDYNPNIFFVGHINAPRWAFLSNNKGRWPGDIKDFRRCPAPRRVR
ncbi:MAG: hypothetical protein WBM84_16895, partial [Sedimenticolaceae bacterium]